MQNTPQTATAGNPVVEPNTQAFLDELAAQGGPQIYELSVEDARGVLSAAQGGEVRKLPAEIEDRTIPGGPKGHVVPFAVVLINPRLIEEGGVSYELPLLPVAGGIDLPGAAAQAPVAGLLLHLGAGH